MSILFEVTDPRGRKVVCTEEQWNGHVLDKRPWMADYQDRVAQAIRQPTFGIYGDSDFIDRNIYYLRDKNRYIKAVVEFDEHGDGRLITAFPAESMKRGEVLLWPEPKKKPQSKS